jgi:HEAT repeat protein
VALPVPAPEAIEVWPAPTPEAFERTLRIQAMTGLLDTHGEQVIPMLRAIALDRSSPDEARQAVFALGQSRRPDVERTMIEVAHDGAEPVRVAAVRELGRFNGPTVTTELMRVYTMANTPLRLKRQVVSSFGDRADNDSLFTIVKLEPEPAVRDLAIVTLGRTGALKELRTLYVQGPRVSRPAVLTALCTAKDDDELIRIAKTERDPALRLRARQQLRMLATPKALTFLEKNP